MNLKSARCYRISRNFGEKIFDDLSVNYIWQELNLTKCYVVTPHLQGSHLSYTIPMTPGYICVQQLVEQALQYCPSATLHVLLQWGRRRLRGRGTQFS